MLIGLALIVALVLVLPLTVKAVERNIEVFLLATGIAAVSVSQFLGHRSLWSWQFVLHALTQPLLISAVVLVAGVVVHYFGRSLASGLCRLEDVVGTRTFFFIAVAFLGILSSVITVIIASIILVEVITISLGNDTSRTRMAVIGCFSIGLGAALTPVGEPLSTIFVSKLQGAPYYAGFFFLFTHFGAYVIPGILAVSALSMFVPLPEADDASPERPLPVRMAFRQVFIRTAKVYIFIMALVFLGTGLTPLVETYVLKLPGWVLYWVNMVSAVIDNATLTSAEIDPKMNLRQMRDVLMGLLISGGMLIPGNIPNIIAAERLDIGSKKWAAIGVPIGIVLMTAYFIVFLIV